MKRVVVVALIAAMVVCNTVGCSDHDESKNIADSVKTTDVEDEAKERDLSYLDNVELEGETDVSEIETESDVGTDNSDVEQSEDVTWDDILKVSSDGDSSTNISIDYIPSEVIDKIYDFITNSGTLTIYTESDTIFEFKYMKDMKARSELIDYGDGYTWWDGTRFLIHTPDESSYQDGDLQRWRINDFDYDKYDFVKQFIDFLNENRTNCGFSTKDYGFYIGIENLGNKVSFGIGCGFTVDNKLKTFGIDAYDDTRDSTGDSGIFSCFVTDTSIPQYSDGLNTSETYLMYTYPESEIEHTLGVIDRILNCFNGDVVGSIDTTVVDASTDTESLTAQSEVDQIQQPFYVEEFNGMFLVEKEEIVNFEEQLTHSGCPKQTSTPYYHICEFYDRGDGTGYLKRFKFSDRNFIVGEDYLHNYVFSEQNEYDKIVFLFNPPYVPDFVDYLYDNFINYGRSYRLELFDGESHCTYIRWGILEYSIVDNNNGNILTVSKANTGGKVSAWFCYGGTENCYTCPDFGDWNKYDVSYYVKNLLMFDIRFEDSYDNSNYSCIGNGVYGVKKFTRDGHDYDNYYIYTNDEDCMTSEIADTVMTLRECSIETPWNNENPLLYKPPTFRSHKEEEINILRKRANYQTNEAGIVNRVREDIGLSEQWWNLINT